MSPMANVAPDAGSQLTAGAGSVSSVAVTSYSTGAPDGEVASATTASGSRSTGAVSSPPATGRRNTSIAPLVSPSTSDDIVEPKATQAPSALIDGKRLKSLPPCPRAIARVVCATVSRTTTSIAPKTWPGKKLLAPVWNATRRPSPLIEGP